MMVVLDKLVQDLVGRIPARKANRCPRCSRHAMSLEDLLVGGFPGDQRHCASAPNPSKAADGHGHVLHGGTGFAAHATDPRKLFATSGGCGSLTCLSRRPPAL